MNYVHIGKKLSIEDVYKVSRLGSKVLIDKDILDRVEKGHKDFLKILESGKKIYGVTTGVGALGDTSTAIPSDKLIKTHMAGSGPKASDDIVRATMLIRAHNLARGYSGVRKKVILLLIEMLNKGLIPEIKIYGSVGASGDLSPLAYLAAAIRGFGRVHYNGRVIRASEAFKEAGLSPIMLEAREAIAIMNGTSYSAGISALAVKDASILCKLADLAAAMSAEALLAKEEYFDSKLNELKLHEGQKIVADNIRRLIKGSELISSKEKVQDAYSIRCVPQIHGAARDLLTYVLKIVENEINSVSDNPLIIDGRVISGGNFHGEHLALAMDCLSIAMSILAGISERRIFRILDNNLNEGLPPFLGDEKGDPGLMLLQYTAASLAAEIRTLSTPISVNSIPTSANQEDYVSMSALSALKLLKVIENVTTIIAIELIVSTKALNYRMPVKLGKGTNIAYELLKDVLSLQIPSEMISITIDRLNAILKMVEHGVGALK